MGLQCTLAVVVEVASAMAALGGLAMDGAGRRSAHRTMWDSSGIQLLTQIPPPGLLSVQGRGSEGARERGSEGSRERGCEGARVGVGLDFDECFRFWSRLCAAPR